MLSKKCNLPFLIFAQSYPTLTTPWTAAHQASLSFTISQVRACSNLCPLSGWCHPSLPLSSTSSPALNLFHHQSLFWWVALHIRWPKYWRFSFSICPADEYSGLISFRSNWFDLLAIQGTLKSLSRVFSNTTVQKHQSFCAQPSLWSNCHLHTWLPENVQHILIIKQDCVLVSNH